MRIPKIENVEKCNSVDNNKVRFYIEVDSIDAYIDIDLKTLSCLQCTFEIGTINQAAMLMSACEALNGAA